MANAVQDNLRHRAFTLERFSPGFVIDRGGQALERVVPGESACPRAGVENRMRRFDPLFGEGKGRVGASRLVDANVGHRVR